MKETKTMSKTPDERVGLLSMARKVLEFKGGETERRDAFPYFFENHNRLFNIITSGRCDLGHLEMMMSMMENIDSGAMTVSSASIEVANMLNAIYVDPVVPKPTTDQAVKPGEETSVTVIENR